METKDDNIINLYGDLEKFFIDDTYENGRFFLSIGTKGSGKTYLMVSYLKYVLYFDIFDYIHFVCPSYLGEQSKSYDFLKNQKQVNIYPHYHEKISKRVDKDRKKGRTLFLIDDASGELLKNIDNTLIQLITTTRHFKGLNIWIAVHSCKKILTPIIRQNIDYLFIYKIVNGLLVKDLYDEYFSMTYDNFKEFKNVFSQLMEEKYNCLLYTNHNEYMDNNVKNWKLLKYKIELKKNK